MKTTPLRLLPALALVVALAAPAAGLPARGPGGCAAGPVEAAAAELVHPHADVLQVEEVGDLRTALVIEPLVHPGVRHRLVATEGGWCDVSGFNTAWRAGGGPGEALAVAEAFASVAAAPYFDQVTVIRRRELVPGVVELRTHARTNGVVADWIVTVDRRGVATASWTAVEFARKPFEAQWEGITALPGAARDYKRLRDGTVDMVQELLPDVAEQPGLYTDAKTPDGFTIRVSLGDTTVSPDPGIDTGVDRVDIMRRTRDMALDNYTQFHTWGMRKDWRPSNLTGIPDLGYIHIDSAITAFCIACVWIREDFQIHLSSNVVAALEVLGWSYPDERLAFSNVIGHEMIHNFQNRYYKPQSNGSAHVAFLEGTARFSETLHPYSKVSHQPDSLIYSTGRSLPAVSLASNSCNGWMGSNPDATFARGPFDGKTYNACYFWLTWHDKHGVEGLVALFEAMYDAVAETSGYQTVHQALEAVSDDVAEDLAIFARAAVTKRGYVYPAGDGSGEALDWSQWLDGYEPRALAPGESRSANLGSGGLVAVEVPEAAVVDLDAPGQVALYLITDDGEEARHTAIASGHVLGAPAEGERRWVVAVNPAVESAPATISLS